MQTGAQAGNKLVKTLGGITGLWGNHRADHQPGPLGSCLLPLLRSGTQVAGECHWDWGLQNRVLSMGPREQEVTTPLPLNTLYKASDSAGQRPCTKSHHLCDHATMAAQQNTASASLTPWPAQGHVQRSCRQGV